MSKMVSNHTQFDLHWISYWRFCYVREMMSLSTVYLRTNWFPPQTRQKRNKPSYIQIYFHIAYTEEKFLPHHLLMQDFSLCFYIKKIITNENLKSFKKKKSKENITKKNFIVVLINIFLRFSYLFFSFTHIHRETKQKLDC